MKAKLVLMCLFSIAILFSASPYNLAFANNSDNMKEKEDVETNTEEELDLRGSLENIPVRSLLQPFRVTKNNHSVNIYYLQNLSDISIEITNEFGQVVYSNNVNAVSGGSLHIDILNWSSGIYTIQFRKSFGNRIYGDFEI